MSDEMVIENVFDGAPEPEDVGRTKLGLAIVAGLAAAIVGAIIWALFTFETGMALGLIAIAVGALVGLAVRKVGNSADPKFGVVGAACAAFGWALGTVLCDIAFLAKEVERPFIDVAIALDLSQIASLAMSAADGMDVVFCAIAIYEGYRFSLRKDVDA